MDEILPNLWIGDILSTYNISNLQSKNICTIISVNDQPLPQWLRTRYLELGFSHTDFRVQDDALEDILQIMKDACEVIDKSLRENRGVLVHCGLGISRSGTVVLGYVMRKRALNREEALAVVRQTRSRVQPNTGFWEQLDIWHDCHHDVFENFDGKILEKEIYREWKAKVMREMGSRVSHLTQSQSSVEG
ncbi:putative dual specificity protein [Botrytis fragariae]|uniref:protein-tyrosine-phosphatase n=1 Tax=Botrytis fragariae TaxID=1964551 RepID=A0A8H6AI77_9HELO|nr:putative dual specificity protein [Botrytis fragariae]KAF5867799.1 putative dual specificity protein [Botrytis fragariae]